MNLHQNGIQIYRILLAAFDLTKTSLKTDYSRRLVLSAIQQLLEQLSWRFCLTVDDEN